MPKYCYIIADGWLEIVNVNTASNPFHVGAIDLVTNVRSVFVKGNIAYVVGTEHLYIVDVTIKSAPVLLFDFNDVVNFALAENIFIKDNWAYIVGGAGNNGYLQLVNITNLLAPVLGGRITSGGATRLFGPTGVFIKDDYAYVTPLVDAGNGSALEIIDVSDKQNPAHEMAIVWAASQLGGIWIDGNYAYVTDTVGDWLYVVDITDPTAAVEVGSIQDGGLDSMADPRGCYAKGNWCYVCVNNDGGGLSIIDVTQKNNPTQSGFIADGDPGPVQMQGSLDVRTSGNFSFVIATTSDCLQNVDVNDQENPAYEGRINDGDGGAHIDAPNSMYMDIWETQANFVGVPRRGIEILTVDFTDLSTSEGTIASWLWDFGDGQTGTEQNPTHIYRNPGKYTVRLTVGN